MKKVENECIGGNKMRPALSTATPAFSQRNSALRGQDRGFPDAGKRTASMLHACGACTNSKIDGIDIGCTGPVYPRTGEIGDVEFLKNWKGENLVAALEANAAIIGAACAWQTPLQCEGRTQCRWILSQFRAGTSPIFSTSPKRCGLPGTRCARTASSTISPAHATAAAFSESCSPAWVPPISGCIPCALSWPRTAGHP